MVSFIVHLKRLRILILLLLFSSCVDRFNPRKEIITTCKPGTEAVRKVLFIGLDGVRTDALQLADTPAIDSLIQHSFVSWDTDRGPHAVSVPGWSTILHGVWPEKHGLTENSFKNNQYGNYPDLFKRAKCIKPNLSVASLSNWDDFLKITSSEDFAQRYDTDLSLFIASKDKLLSCCPDMMLLHFDDPDHAGHTFGFSPNCTEYIKAIETMDEYIFGLMEIIHNRELNFGEEWMIVITTDHGGEGTGHGGQDDLVQTRKVWSIVRVPFLASPMQQAQVNSVDLLPTMLYWLGIDTGDFPDLDGVKFF